MEIIYLLIGLLVGGIAAWLLGRSIQKSRFLEKEKTLENLTANEKQLRITAETRLEEKSLAWDESTKLLKQTFEATASNALKSNNTVFLDLAKQSLENYITQAKGDFKQRQTAIEEILKPFKISLEKQEKLTHHLESSTKETFGGLKNYLDQLKESQKNLTKETGALVSALKSPKVRGRWGEIGLKRIVEFSGMNSFCDFTEQTSVTTEDGRLRPDMIVKLPGGRSVIVDSKVPLNAYLESLETEDEAVKKNLILKHAKDVREHMNNLSSKGYWVQFDNSADFVILYMEIESAFGTALLNDRDLILDGIRNKIIFATPTTLITLLRTVAMSWKQQEITENAKKIWEAGRELFERICTFAENLGGVGRGIEGAIKSYNAAVGSWESRVIPGIKKLKELGADTEKKELPEISEIEIKAREIKPLQENL